MYRGPHLSFGAGSIELGPGRASPQAANSSSWGGHHARIQAPLRPGRGAIVICKNSFLEYSICVWGVYNRVADSSTVKSLTRFGSTLRRDAWWIENLPFIIVISAFGIYTTWRAFEGKFYECYQLGLPYLSPFYSPLIDPAHHWWPFSPAILILAGPLGFRTSCYYYRKAIYRGFLLDPPACAVSEGGGRNYRGETAFPFILQNVHRYFFYIAVIFVAFLWYDAILAFDFDGKFGIGVGTVIMLVNIVLLTTYTFSCHSLRHLIGGKLDCFSCSALGGPRHSAWRGVTILNEHHMFWAWVSMISVGLTDLYIRLVASGALKDFRLL